MENFDHPTVEAGYTSRPYRPDRIWGILLIFLATIGALCLTVGIGPFSILFLPGPIVVGIGITRSKRWALIVVAVESLLTFANSLMYFALASMPSLGHSFIWEAGVSVLSGLNGFVWLAVLSGPTWVNGFTGLPEGLLLMAANACFLYYAYIRLSGRAGPPPV